MRCFGWGLGAALLARSLSRAEGEGLRRGEYEALHPFIGSDDGRASSGRGERSARSYSLGFFRIGGLVRLCKGRIGPSRENPRRGR